MAGHADSQDVNKIAGADGARAAPGSASLTNLRIEYLAPERLRPAPSNARRHSKKQLKQIARSIERFGFVNPVLISDDFEIIAGHGRMEAAKTLGLKQVPAVRLSSLSPADRRAYVIADNRLAQLAGWDRELLATELQGLVDLQFDDLELTGFSLTQIELMLEEPAETKAAEPRPEDELPANGLQGPAVSRPGDLWILGPHRLLCGDALAPTSYQFLLEGQQADLVLIDLPLDVPGEGNVSGLGREANFALAAGDRSEDQFIADLMPFLRGTKDNTKAGAVLFVFVDWCRLAAVMTASRAVGLTPEDLVVWTRDDGQMGSCFYRAGHELVLVLKNGETPLTNGFARGQRDRCRSNVWQYAGIPRFRTGRREDLALHPAAKPAALVADAIRDVTQPGALVLDPFARSGTTIVAAEQTGRHGRAIQLDPLHCDVIVRRWQQYTGKTARLQGVDLSFAQAEAERLAGPNACASTGRGPERSS